MFRTKFVEKINKQILMASYEETARCKCTYVFIL